MRPTAMADFQCVGLGVEGEPGTEVAEARGHDLRFGSGGERA
jgi:hypothetical protein